MPESRFYEPRRAAFEDQISNMNDEDQAQVRGLVHYLEVDPYPDGQRKRRMNPMDENEHLCVFDDGRWRVVYHVSPEEGLIIYGLTKKTGVDGD